MIATKDTTVQDLEASLQNCLSQREECDMKLRHEQSRLVDLQRERATFASAQDAREQEEAAFRPQVREASDMLAQARDYTKAATGTVKNTARDEELAAQELYNETRAQLQDLTKKHQAETDIDRPFIDVIESKIRSTKLAVSQLESQQVALGQTRQRLHAELGQSRYDVLSALLRQPREEQTRLEAALDKTGDIYARLRAESFPQLDEWPDLKRKLQEENSIVDNGDINALTQFAALCEYVAAHPIQDMRVVELFEISTYNIAAYEGGSNSMYFAECARLARMKLAELQAK